MSRKPKANWLSETEKKRILAAHKSGVPQTLLAERFSVTQSCISITIKAQKELENG